MKKSKTCTIILRVVFAVVICSLFMPRPAHALDLGQNPPLYSAMKDRMSYLGERQAVLSKNISNANTPHYKAKEVLPFDFKKKALARSGKLPMQLTNSMHIAGAHGSEGKFRVVKDADAFETTPMGNNVVLDEQMYKAAENNLDYQATTNLYKKWVALQKSAVANR